MDDRSRSSSAEGVAWNLADLYGGTQDRSIEADLNAALSLAQAFEARYRGAFAVEGGIAPRSLCEALTEFEALHDNASAGDAREGLTQWVEFLAAH